jgi:hypothetical protein
MAGQAEERGSLQNTVVQTVHALALHILHCMDGVVVVFDVVVCVVVVVVVAVVVVVVVVVVVASVLVVVVVVVASSLQAQVGGVVNSAHTASDGQVTLSQMPCIMVEMQSKSFHRPLVGFMSPTSMLTQSAPVGLEGAQLWKAGVAASSLCTASGSTFSHS